MTSSRYLREPFTVVEASLSPGFVWLLICFQSAVIVRIELDVGHSSWPLPRSVSCSKKARTQNLCLGLRTPVMDILFSGLASTLYGSWATDKDAWSFV